MCIRDRPVTNSRAFPLRGVPTGPVSTIRGHEASTLAPHIPRIAWTVHVSNHDVRHSGKKPPTMPTSCHRSRFPCYRVSTRDICTGRSRTLTSPQKGTCSPIRERFNCSRRGDTEGECLLGVLTSLSALSEEGLEWRM